MSYNYCLLEYPARCLDVPFLQKLGEMLITAGAKECLEPDYKLEPNIISFKSKGTFDEPFIFDTALAGLVSRCKTKGNTYDTCVEATLIALQSYYRGNILRIQRNPTGRYDAASISLARSYGWEFAGYASSNTNLSLKCEKFWKYIPCAYRPFHSPVEVTVARSTASVEDSNTTTACTGAEAEAARCGASRQLCDNNAPATLLRASNDCETCRARYIAKKPVLPPVTRVKKDRAHDIPSGTKWSEYNTSLLSYVAEPVRGKAAGILLALAVTHDSLETTAADAALSDGRKILVNNVMTLAERLSDLMYTASF